MTDYSRNKNLKVLLQRTSFSDGRFLVRMNGQPWPVAGHPVSITRLVTVLQRSR